MNSYTYEAVDAAGLKCNGILEVTSQSEALQRIKDMGLFPTRVKERNPPRPTRMVARPGLFAGLKGNSFTGVIFGRRVKPAAVAVFTRQLATFLNAGLPLLRGLRLLARAGRMGC